MIERRLASQGGVLLLDGGVATELERAGHDLSDALWSARLLLDAPQAIRAVTAAYLEAGADVVTSGSYQATVGGLASRGLSEDEARAALRASLRPTREAAHSHAALSGYRPLVAASVGPYGAAQADGSEYTGDYGLEAGALEDWHRERLRLFEQAGADLLGFETIPSLAETEALAALLAEVPGPPAWVSFQCRDDAHLADGTPLERAVELAEDVARVAAVGVNCVPPSRVLPLLERCARATGKPLLVYPNSGEAWDAASRRWSGVADPLAFAEAARAWVEAGAQLIGGCCRTTPAHIAELRRAFPRP